MKKQFLLVVVLLVTAVIGLGCQSEKGELSQDHGSVQLTVSAAASLKDVLTELASKYEKEHENVKIRFNFGSSGALQQQIEQGAPVDLFFSASEDKFNKLVSNDLISQNNSVKLLKNDLVLIVPKGKTQEIKNFKELTKDSVGKLAIGIPESVPAGKYAKETLSNLHLWNQVQSKFVYGKDVRQVLSYIETNNADAGFVYQTDALASDQIEIVDIAKNNLHSPIIYPLGIVKNTKHRRQSDEFYQFLQSDQAIEAMEKYGFKKG
ncbi:molybdate ABC transporter substrate-binding protein [Bacillus sp. CLL-7-23]|uniref:Molybdate ABC transporter substrate-binding protein n=1 Tax=Bacillus changyiensis TaxID=3004103 RepID=A0ABT4X3R4_9BACI|nr:molybdate ABC transporter substrate-binding protein [Bacillus changyiensis]MDA7026032.1 molybdate ABC transporter substrate-binding protein [Bacillus changyiensis]